MAHLTEDYFDNQFEKLTRSLKDQGGVDIISQLFAENKTDNDRVAFLLALDEVNKHIKFPDHKDVKSSASATRYRNEGNKVFQKRRYQDSLRLYTQSISFSPHYRDGNKSNTDPDLSLAHANRSAALYHLGLYRECLVDVTTALQSSYPAKLTHKLYMRRAQSQIKLGLYSDAVVACGEGQNVLEDSEMDIHKKAAMFTDFQKLIDKYKNMVDGDEGTTDPFEGICCDRCPPELLTPHATYPSLSTLCNIVYTPEGGRHLVASEDINPGDIILVEDPYASVLLAENYVNFCHHCYTHSYALQGCPHCTQALYCGSECRTASWDSYHQYECGMLGSLHASGVGKFGYLALRCVLRDPCSDVAAYQQRTKKLAELSESTKPSESGELVKLSESGAVCGGPPLQRGCNQDDLYLPTDYHTINTLVTHSNDRPKGDLFRRAITAVFLLKSIQKSSYFTDNQDPDLETFIGGMLLTHLQAFPCNAHEIAHFVLDKVNLVASMPIELGAGIYSSLSLFNHSCDPGVNRNFYGSRCIVRAIKTIRRGEEIADNYGTVYAVQPREQRLEKLRGQYYFTCQCTACKGNWPLYPSIENINPSWRCSTCHKPAESDDTNIKCQECNLTESIQDRLSAMMPAQNDYECGFESLMMCDVDRSLPKLTSYLQHLDSNLVLPWREYNNCQEAVKQCLSIMANCHITLPNKPST